MTFDECFDVVVIGAGHAGCEAASAAARMGVQTALITLSLETIGQMSCNPAIGGIAKGHIVREIDALGGVMGKVIDRTGIHFRLLNRSRGPAVQAPRAQADRALYRQEMRETLEATPNLHLRQGLVVDFIVQGERMLGVELQDTRRIGAKSIVLASGTFLNGQIHTGKRRFGAGRAGEPASTDLAEALKRLGFPVGRLKTGTPPRLDGRTIDWSAFEAQMPDEVPVPFSFSTEKIEQPQIPCYVGYTNEQVHDLIRANLHHSPLYSGQITGVGPRYCPSIEDKVVKFSDKSRHQLFLEPEGRNTYEIYLNGFSTSLPAEIQQDLIHKIPGFESAKIIRPGYAIEYDYVDPRELNPYLQTIRYQGLFFSGQINGTTGYEEAACQGLMAGINAALYSQQKGVFRLRREESYIGVLIDDLIHHGVDEPYRIFTSRAEERLSLRYDTADSRLTPFGRTLGLVNDEEWDKFNNRCDAISKLRVTLETTRFVRSSVEYAHFSTLLGRDLGDAISLQQLSNYRDINNREISRFLPNNLSTLPPSLLETALADLHYRGYIESQRKSNALVSRSDALRIPENFDFRSVGGLSHEMVERLERSKPANFGQARRIPGFTPAAAAALLVHLHLAEA
ncbi:MAG TPA: tRNA uridine-5-carboxymethylaminomethyl(34) synthesis enzyme MnmG [Pyrinomonadaceae bacterium]|nr:tRNA uridine-5-carboxymethylaminomethyl(34) synthesis enzyme MnmG [Pyrinomonadaceae bacterium]